MGNKAEPDYHQGKTIEISLYTKDQRSLSEKVADSTVEAIKTPFKIASRLFDEIFDI